VLGQKVFSESPAIKVKAMFKTGMNWVLKKSGSVPDWYLLTIRYDGEKYLIHPIGITNFLQATKTPIRHNPIGPFQDLNETHKRIKKMINIKKKLGYVLVDESEALPSYLTPHLAPELSSFISEEEMWKLIESAKNERYVFFNNNIGLEDRFDLDMEYLGYVDIKDEDFIYVYDKFGEICSCSLSRFSKVVPTERTLELPKKLVKKQSCRV
jgi:hypothetical protein